METFKKYLIALIYKKPFIYISIFILIGYMITTLVNNKLEQIRKEEEIQKQTISKLDKQKQKFIDSEVLKLKPIEDKEKELTLELDSLKSKIEVSNKCINGVISTMGTLGRYDCTKQPGFLEIPKASASEEVNSEIVLLKPNELFYTTKKLDGCHISQNEQSHFTKAGGYMLATDVACDFNKDGKADQAEVYAPDYFDNSVTYTITKKHDDLLGDYIELLFNEYNDNPKNIIKEPRNKKWIIGHTTTKLKDGDVVTTGQRIGQNNLTGYTTGYHSHIELWSLIDGKWKNISYTNRSDTLNKMRNTKTQGFNYGDSFYFTSYNLGDEKQNDKNACIGASGEDLCKSKEKHIALTIDVRNDLGIKLGDKVKLNGPCTDEYIVSDEMNCRFRGDMAQANGDCFLKDKKTKASGNIFRDGYLIKGDIAIPLGTQAKCSGIYYITKI